MWCPRSDCLLFCWQLDSFSNVVTCFVVKLNKYIVVHMSVNALHHCFFFCRCEEGEVIATIPLGYADGYNRLLSGKGIITTDKGELRTTFYVHVFLYE